MRAQTQDIVALAFEAAQAGDFALRQRCEDALEGDDAAWRELLARVYRDRVLGARHGSMWLQDLAINGEPCCTVAEFVYDNAECAEEALAALVEGGEYVSGGGAAPLFEVRLLPLGPEPEPEEGGTACSHSHHHWDDVCAYDGAEEV